MQHDSAQLRDLEQEIVRIANVQAAAIRVDTDGNVDSVDVIADRNRSPQRIVRDVEIILRSGGVDVDHRKIGVAALDSPEAVLGGARRNPGPETGSTQTPAQEEPEVTRQESPRSAPEGDSAPRMAVLDYEPDSERVRLTAVHSSTRDGAFSVEVELAVGAYEGLPGRAEGPAPEPVGCAALVARATLDAVRNLLQPGYEAQLRELRIVDMGGLPMVAVTVDFGEGRRLQKVAGACLQHGSLNDTAVYATLDAINRPLGRARFRQLAVLDSEETPVQARQARA
ncbi:MAG TPA: hypothetical protein VKA86_01110 [Candidatus Krumholzibacteria bacterium]|nr:hypothetical protein [Candidatus Krumholzibacteria bacterium]